MDKARFGFARDLQQIKQGSALTAGELREFMQDMKGKNPHEVLGMIAQSSLVQATITASIWTIGLFAIGTLLPYYVPFTQPFFGPSGATAHAAAPVVAAPGAPATPAGTATPGAPTQPGAPANQASAAGGAPTGPGTAPAEPDALNIDKAGGPKRSKKSDDVLDKLGVGDEKMADPNSNPLDKNEDLFKGSN